MSTRPIIISLLLCFSLASFSQGDSTRSLKVQPLPSVFHTPETSWGFGLTLLGYYNPLDSATKESNAQIFIDATLNRQLSFQSDFNLFTSKNKHYIRGSHDLSKFPEFYFGIGNENDSEHRCLIKINYFDFKTSFFTKLKKDIYLGPTFHHQSLGHINKNIEQDGFIIDDMGYSFTAGGLALLIDKRNNLLNPSSGYYFESTLSRYWDHGDMTSGYFRNSIDARYYHTFDKLIFNSNVYTIHNNGVVPFRLMPGLGGARFLRGYYAGRFRDNNLSLAQIEFRRKLFWRIGVAAFTGVGQVYSDVRNFDVNRFHYNYGGGLRFELNKESEANIRLDYGRTRDSQGVYIVFGECF